MGDLSDMSTLLLPDYLQVRRLTQRELADLLGVTPSAVSQATKEGRPCSGHPVSEWATRRNGQVIWYEVPDQVVEDERPPTLKEILES